MRFKSLYITYLLFCVCLIGYNLEAQSQPSTSQIEATEAYFRSGIEKIERSDFENAIKN